MVIAPNTVVSITYTLREENVSGVIIQEVNNSDPFLFMFGVGQLLPQFEASILGKKAGDTAAFGIEAENAYGLEDPEKMVSLPKSTFVIDGEVAEEFLKIGAMIPLQTQEGDQLTGHVVEIDEESVKVDLNHPLAGKDLHFSVEVLSVRVATEEEITHGHAHGAGGIEH